MFNAQKFTRYCNKIENVYFILNMSQKIALIYNNFINSFIDNINKKIYNIKV